MSYTTEQIKEHRLKWIEALESGDFSQTKGQLADSTGFCCLGVACKISDNYKLTNNFNFGLNYNGEIVEWVGTFHPSIREYLDMHPYDVNQAVYMNDTQSKSFPEIAAYFRTLWNLPKIEEGVTQNEIHN